MKIYIVGNISGVHLSLDKLTFQVHPNLDKLLEHYSSKGKIGLRHITLPGRQSCFIILLIICEYFDYLYPGPQPNLRGLQHLYIQRWENPLLATTIQKLESEVYFYNFRWTQKKRLNELIPYNDCFYRNMYR